MPSSLWAMSQVTFTTASPLAPRPRSGSGKNPETAKGYDHAAEVNYRAGAMPKRMTIEEQAALIRLDKILSRGEPLRDDVPRGYHLNFRV